MDIEFRSIMEFPRGTLCALLKEGYLFEPKFERDCIKQWREFNDKKRQQTEGDKCVPYYR